MIKETTPIGKLMNKYCMESVSIKYQKVFRIVTIKIPVTEFKNKLPCNI